MYSYIVEYNSDFIEDIKEITTYITNVLKNEYAANKLLYKIEKAIIQRH